MKKVQTLWIILLVCCIAFSSFPPVNVSAQASVENGSKSNNETVPGEIVVSFRVSPFMKISQQAAALAGDIHAQVVRTSPSGLALLAVNKNQDIASAITRLESSANVLFAEPNYVYRVPKIAAGESAADLQHDWVIRPASESQRAAGIRYTASSADSLRAMKTRKGLRVRATYPNDTDLTLNQGWFWIGADIVWPDTAAGKGVCLVDTGVDYLHKDLAGSVIKGKDFVNEDNDPMDDNGHGTAVAGIIAAKRNNAMGIIGVSTGKVVAVKAMTADGWGTAFDIAQAILYCAARTDISVINLSLSGPDPSQAIEVALDRAVLNSTVTQQKLVVAAAGNSASDVPEYPAAYADSSAYPDYAQKIISVAGSGYVSEDPLIPGKEWMNYDCWDGESNYGDWVTLVAPGANIYTTTPWDRPFWKNQFEGVKLRYDTMSGSSLAAAFVSGAAGRIWRTGATPELVYSSLVNSRKPLGSDTGCWPAEIDSGMLNLAAAMSRFAVHAAAFDSTSGSPLTGAVISTYLGNAMVGSAVIPTTPQPIELIDDPDTVFWGFPAGTDIINLPFQSTPGTVYRLGLNKTGYTTGTILAYQHVNLSAARAGEFFAAGETAVPQKSSSFDVILGWENVASENYAEPDYPWNLDLNLWLPPTAVPGDPAHGFIVGPEGDTFESTVIINDIEVPIDSTQGSLASIPFARWKYDGYQDADQVYRWETITIRNRPGAAAAPYYNGVYTIGVTDYSNDGSGPVANTIDHDSNVSTAEIPLLGTYFRPFIYVWKDGRLIGFSQLQTQAPNASCNRHWWRAATINNMGAVTAETLCSAEPTQPLMPYQPTWYEP